MREYNRATRECSFEEFPPEIVAALGKYAAKNELGNLAADALLCAETSSEKINRGFFSKIFGGGSFAVKTCVVVTPARVLWATLDNKNATAVLSARLNDIEIRNYQSTLIEDTGLEFFGSIGDFPERATAFIGLGDDAAGEKLRRVLKTAAENARRK
jgi:hypothetical protein